MQIESDITFKAEGSHELKLDIYHPEGGSVPTRTAVILVHGGGWMLGERGMLAPLAAQFAKQGFLAVLVEYRLVREAAWPAQRDDVVAATEWVRANADRLGIEADRVVLGGASAGGHLALMATAALGGKASVSAVISLFSASELTLEQPAPKGMFGAPQLVGPDASAEALAAASPLHQISADFPPVFLLHGGGDWMIDPQASINLYQKLVGLGVTAEMHIVAPARWDKETSEHNLFAQGPEAVMTLMQKLLADG